MENTKQTATADTVLDLLRQLPPRDRLKVLVQALPEIEHELDELLFQEQREPGNGQEQEPELDPDQDPLLKYIGKVSHGSLAQGIDKELYGT
jgi:hypothetical protein